MNVPPTVQAFWSTFVATLDTDPSDRFYEAFHFDDNAPSADELAELVVSGQKCATAALVWAFEAEDKPLPKLGDLSVVTFVFGQPVCVIETMDINIVPFCEVGADFAAVEGEGDGSLAYWQRVHTDYFERECARLCREFSPKMPVVCEKFEVIYRGGAENVV